MVTMIFSKNSWYRRQKMNFSANNVNVTFVLLVFCIQIMTVCAKNIYHKHHTLPEDEIRFAPAQHSTSLVNSYKSQTVLLKEPDEKDESATKLVDLTTQDTTWPESLLSIQNIRHKEQKINMSRQKKRNKARKNTVKKSRKKRRRFRSSSIARLGLEKKSCPTRTRYVSKRTATDIHGDIVDVYPVIHIGSLALDQYFYESFCDLERCTCGGINKKKFKSSCQTTYSYTYAKVVKSGDIGWSYIKVRSGCGCVIQEKRKKTVSAVLDLMASVIA